MLTSKQMLNQPQRLGSLFKLVGRAQADFRGKAEASFSKFIYLVLTYREPVLTHGPVVRRDARAQIERERDLFSLMTTQTGKYMCPSVLDRQSTRPH